MPKKKKKTFNLILYKNDLKIDYRNEYKSQNYVTSKENIRENLCDIGLEKDFIRHKKYEVSKKNMLGWTSSKQKPLLFKRHC